MTLTLAAVLLSLAIIPGFAQVRVLRVAEDGIRGSASKVVMPVYPGRSRNRKVHGVAVVTLEYDGNGDVVDVKVEESPDKDTGRSVIDAAQQWKFRPSKLDGQPAHVRGPLTFYFRIDKSGKARVENPSAFK